MRETPLHDEELYRGWMALPRQTGILVTEEVVQAQSTPGTFHPLPPSLLGNKNRLGTFSMEECVVPEYRGYKIELMHDGSA